MTRAGKIEQTSDGRLARMRLTKAQRPALEMIAAGRWPPCDAHNGRTLRALELRELIERRRGRLVATADGARWLELHPRDGGD